MFFARRACAARVTDTVRPSVCLSVLPRFLPPRAQTATPMGSALHWLDWINSDFRKSAAFRSENQVEKPIAMLISTGLPRPDPPALCTSEAQEATTKGVYRVPHAIYYCS